MDVLLEKYRVTFFEETDEHLTLLNESVIAFEKEPDNEFYLNRIFRVLHTLKSSAAAVNYIKLSQITHSAEDLVQSIKDQDIQINSHVIDLLFEVFDYVQTYVSYAKENREEQVSGDDLTERLYQITHHTPGANFMMMNQTKAFSPISGMEIQSIQKVIKPGDSLYQIDIIIEPEEKVKWLRAKLIIKNIERLGQIVKCIPGQSTFPSNNFNGEFTTLLISPCPLDLIKPNIEIDLINRIDVKKLDLSTSSSDPDNNDKKPTEDNLTAQKIRNQTGHNNNSIRVPIQKLDHLMHLVGEMVVLNSSLKLVEQKTLDFSPKENSFHNDIKNISDKLTRLASNLQNGIMNTRMLPVRIIFSQHQRVVRDLSRKEGKEVNLFISGEETEIDKKVLDAMTDPLMHLIRNAVDHGIENPEERIKSGKSRQGEIHLSASQVGNHILIAIKDDGKGINLEQIKSQALIKKLATKANIKSMSNTEILNFIFQPGFSTANSVNAVSRAGAWVWMWFTVRSPAWEGRYK